MHLTTLDYSILIFFFTLVLLIGIIVSKKSGSNSSEYFLSGRNLPWWLLGFSMVATTFAADTPLFVADVVRTDGVSGNWIWWTFLLTGMLTVFLYAKLWRKSGVTTDIEFYELRYSGKPAKFLRGFRAVYLGLVFTPSWSVSPRPCGSVSPARPLCRCQPSVPSASPDRVRTDTR